MPELPDVALYLKALDRRIVGQRVEGFHVRSMSVLRTYRPSHEEVVGKTVVGLRRIGKRIVWELDQDQLFLVIHLMVAGRLRWHDRPGVRPPARVGLASWDFPGSTLVLTEQGSKRRAGIWVVSGEDDLLAQDRGGLEPLEISTRQFAEAIRRRNHTLKRALTSPAILSGIGHAYSDEILWEAGLSPVKMTSRLTDEEAGVFARGSHCGPLLLDRASGHGDRGWMAYQGHGLPAGDGGARKIRIALSPLRRRRAEDRLRQQRDQLLRGLPDGGKAPGRPVPLAIAQEGLAQDAGGTGRVERWAFTLSVQGLEGDRRSSNAGLPL